MWRKVLVVGAFLALGCSGGDDEEESGGEPLEGAPLDCAWIANGNCWGDVLYPVASCVPAKTDTGVLSANGDSCTYASGHSVTFTPPLDLPQSLEEDDDFGETWNFKIQSPLGECIRFEDTATSRTVTAYDKTYREIYRGLGMQVTCPDGRKFATDNTLSLLECENFFEDMPSHTYFHSASSVSFGFSGVEGAEVQAFSCSR